MKINREIAYWLALSRAPLIGYQSFGIIIEKFPTLSDFFHLHVDDYEQMGLHPKTIHYLKNPDWRGIELDLTWVDKSAEHFLLTLNDAAYPRLLREILYPPPILFVKGNPEILHRPQIAIVGSRTPTPSGKEAAYSLASELASLGLVVTSGLALGIDTAAHKGALAVAHSIAVIGTGMEVCYPSSNKELAAAICQNGAIISEFNCNVLPLSSNFPRRNQVISGLSLGTLVVEANLKSGSLITARYALEQGREVFAVPGSIFNSRSRGCHLLLKQGAKLVETPLDVLEELQFNYLKSPLSSIKTKAFKKKTLEGSHLKLLECVGFEPTKIDILVERSNYSVPIVTAILADLELAGYVSSVIGGYMRVS